MKKNSKQSTSLCEQFKIIQTSIDFANVDHKKQILMVTSPESGAGKSTIAAQLASTYAEQGERTLLIGADMRKPSLHKLFHKSATPGLANILIDEVHWMAGIHEIPLQSNELFLMTSGLILPNPSQLLSSEKMKILLTTLRQNFDMIIIDTPPAIVVSDALILAKLVDGIILVCRYRKTGKESAKEAVNKLNLSKTKLLGVIFNGTNNAEHYY